MTKDDLHFLITRLNGVAGMLMNHASGVKPLSAERADMCYNMLMEMESRIRIMDDNSACVEPKNDVTTAAPVSTDSASAGVFDVIGDLAGACLDTATSIGSGVAEAAGEIITGICD